MGNRGIEFLLDLYENNPSYDNNYVKGERRSRERNRKMKQNRKLKNRYLLLDELLYESKPLTLTPNQYRLVKDLIYDFNNRFKELHKQASEETIILAFIFFVKKVEDSRTKVTNWKVCKEYGLTDHVFEIILCRLTLGFMERCPIVPREYGKSDHEVLVREGKRW